MMKFIVAAAVAFMPASQPQPKDVAPQSTVAQSQTNTAQSAISQYIQYGTTCSAVTPWGYRPVCAMAMPMPIGSTCYCVGVVGYGVVTP